MTLPLKIRAIVFIRVSGVRVDRAANASDSGKQVWALMQRRTAFLHRREGKGGGVGDACEIHVNSQFE